MASAILTALRPYWRNQSVSVRFPDEGTHIPVRQPHQKSQVAAWFRHCLGFDVIDGLRPAVNKLRQFVIGLLFQKRVRPGGRIPRMDRPGRCCHMPGGRKDGVGQRLRARARQLRTVVPPQRPEDFGFPRPWIELLAYRHAVDPAFGRRLRTAPERIGRTPQHSHHLEIQIDFVFSLGCRRRRIFRQVGLQHDWSLLALLHLAWVSGPSAQPMPGGRPPSGCDRPRIGPDEISVHDPIQCFGAVRHENAVQMIHFVLQDAGHPPVRPDAVGACPAHRDPGRLRFRPAPLRPAGAGC